MAVNQNFAWSLIVYDADTSKLLRVYAFYFRECTLSLALSGERRDTSSHPRKWEHYDHGMIFNGSHQISIVEYDM